LTLFLIKTFQLFFNSMTFWTHRFRCFHLLWLMKNFKCFESLVWVWIKSL
jgi:hypothetical protein